MNCATAGPTRPRSSAESESGTRCSAAAFILDAGMRHSRDSRSTSSHVAPRASPDRQAVSATKRRHAFADCDALDTSMISRTCPTSP